MCNGECEFRTVVYQGIEYQELEISRCGIMRNRKTGNIYAWSTCGKKYEYLCAMYGQGKGKKKRIRQHRALMETFVENPENKPFINHKDGNKLNNKLSNLEWCTHRENIDHAKEFGLYEGNMGENSGLAKLNWEIVKYIRQNAIPKDKKKGFKALAKKFGVNSSTVSEIYYRKSWKERGIDYAREN